MISQNTERFTSFVAFRDGKYSKIHILLLYRFSNIFYFFVYLFIDTKQKKKNEQERDRRGPQSGHDSYNSTIRRVSHP